MLLPPGTLVIVCALLGAGACMHAGQSRSGGAGLDAQSTSDGAPTNATDGAATSARLPLVLVADVDLGGGDLTVFDIRQPGVVLVGHDSPGANSHSVAADPAAHRVFFPLMAGPKGTPVLRIMRPTGT